MLCYCNFCDPFSILSYFILNPIARSQYDDKPPPTQGFSSDGWGGGASTSVNNISSSTPAQDTREQNDDDWLSSQLDQASIAPKTTKAKPKSSIDEDAWLDEASSKPKPKQKAPTEDDFFKSF